MRIPDDVMEDLLKYQRDSIVTAGAKNITDDFHYNWKEFFDRVLADRPSALKEEDNRVLFIAENVPLEWPEWAKQIIWYGRRNKRTIKKTERVDS